MPKKFVFSQMFDVRPRRETGHLDLEKIQRIEAVLNLKITRDFKKLKKAINLKKRKAVFEKQAGHICPISDITEKLVGMEESVSGGHISESFPKTLPSWPRKYQEIGAVDQSDILSVFDALENAHQVLNRSLVVPVENIVEVQETFEPVAVVAPLTEKPEDIWENIENISEENIIEESPAEDDLVLAFEDDIFLAGPEPIQKATPALKWKPFDRVVEKDIVISLNEEGEERHFGDILSPRKIFNRKKSLAAFLAAAFLIFSVFPVAGWVNQAVSAKSSVLNYGLAGYGALVSAKESLLKKDFSGAENHFAKANMFFASADSQLSEAGGFLLVLLEKAPGLSYVSSRIKLVKAGEELSKAGQNFTHLVNLLGESSLNLDSAAGEMIFPSALNEGKDYLESAIVHLTAGNEYLQGIKVSALPEDIQSQLSSLQNKLPEALAFAQQSLQWSDKFLEIFGGEKAKKYLLVFQNNAEMRPTGGFIGTYGILDLDQGQIKNIFIDGIFNPDGQLQEKVIPPSPIQKISTAWSMHDSNWFADFPTSARKIMWFYEKTGGETTDGVIAFTPAIIERLLERTGPIELPAYGLSLGSGNFVEETQYKVELDYDKEENRPKKILSDFTPLFIEKVAAKLKAGDLETLKIVNDCLKQKHVLFYFSEPELEEFVAAQGWAGQILSAEQDFFSVVHTNINGYKTDRVIAEEIRHSSEIQEDGSIIDTLEITRRHNGGSSRYEWYNKVNSDFMRVYLPKGSQLISASGQTREKIVPPIDYSAKKFSTDPDVAAQESGLVIDEKTGTYIFEESGKTVFGNWVYVSPGESTSVIYKYRLPFKLDIDRGAAYSLLAQKQSGSEGSRLDMVIKAPSSWESSALTFQPSQSLGNLIQVSSDLKEDRRFGVFFKKK